MTQIRSCTFSRLMRSKMYHDPPVVFPMFDAGFFHFMLGESRVRSVTEALTSTVSLFFVGH